MGQKSECGLAVSLRLGVSPVVKTVAGAAFSSESSAERGSTTQLTRGLLAPFSSLQVVGPRASVLLWLSARDVLNSCRQGLSIGKLSTWQQAPLEEAEGAREYEQDGRQSLFVT